MSFDTHIKTVRDQLEKVVFGQSDAIDLVLVALFSCGHVLLEGPPGVAKTLLVRSLAAALNFSYRRVQMTPDLLPNDVTGSVIYREDNHEFEFRPGPLFANFVLADEINRASARTQSSLLEAMQELQVTHAGLTHPLPDPFVVFATQNPIDEEGTYPLPLAQLDRFMFKISIDYPSADAEQMILKSHHATSGLSSPERMNVERVLGPAEIIADRQLIRETFVRDEVIAYVQRLVHCTRTDEVFQVGASPRSGLMLLVAAKGLARLRGRDFVTPDDVKEVYLPALRHRVVLHAANELAGTSPDEALAQVLEQVEVPR